MLGLLCFWSRNVTAVYFVQWVLIGWGILLWGCSRCGSLPALAMGGVVLLLAHLIVRAYAARLGN